MSPFRNNGKRLAVCMVILAAAVVVRFIWPSAADKVGKKLAPTLFESINYKEAFAAIGGAIRGERGLGEALEVFFPAD